MLHHAPYKGRPYLLIALLFMFCLTHVLVQLYDEHISNQVNEWISAQKPKLEVYDQQPYHIHDMVERSLASYIRPMMNVHPMQGRCTIIEPWSPATIQCHPEEITQILSFLPRELRVIMDKKIQTVFHRMTFSFSPTHIHLDQLN